MKALSCIIVSFLVYFNCYSQEIESDSIAVTIFVQFLVTEDGSIKRILVPLVEGGESLSRKEMRTLKNKAKNEVFLVGKFDPSEEKQLYRMPFRFVFEEGYDFDKLNL